MSDTTQSGVSFEDAAEALLSNWGIEDDESPSKTRAIEADAEPEEPETETETGNEDEADEEVLDVSDDEPDPAAEAEAPKTEKRLASDDDEVVVKVGGEEHRLSVKELSRLYGQEKSLTIKGQELAAQRKSTDDQSMVAMGVLERMYAKAQERYRPYEGVDLFKASRDLAPEDFDALRTEMQKAAEDKNFFEAELSSYVQSLRQARDEHLRSRSGEAQRVIREKIPTWSDNTYDEVRSYAIKEGMHPDAVNTIVDPSALAMIWKARAYDAAKARAASATRPVVAKVPNKGQQTRPSSAASAKAAVKTPQSASLSRFKQTGSREDAMEALIARWSAED